MFFKKGGNLLTSLQKTIIKEMGVLPTIDPRQEIQKTIKLMKDYLIAHPFLKALVLGISGGQDSTLLGKLAQIAMQEMRQETGDESYQFIAVRLPYAKQLDNADVDAVIDWIEPDQVYTVNIQGAVDAAVKEIEGQGISISDFNKGNIKARQRMIIQYAIAGEYAGVVLGSDHAAESVTGFYTKFGDGAADMMPLYRLNKRQGAQMLLELDAPPYFYEKVPTADLQDNQPALPDEVELGVSYEEIDDYLEGKYVPEEAQRKIEQLYLNSQHKRNLPITIFSQYWKK